MSRSALAAARYPRSPDDLVTEHLPLVRRLAWHVHGRMSSAIELDDLVQIGLVALVEAARGYQDRGFEFSTYASMRIKGAMIDQLRKGARQTRGAGANRRRIDEARRRIEATNHRRATSAEIARELGLDADEYRTLEQGSAQVAELSVDELYSDSDPAFADEGPGPEDVLDDSRTRHMLASAIATLPERDQLVLQLYFVEELNLEEIGRTLNVSAARICQIKASAMKALRRKLSLST